jgi:hypothetical protein
MDNLLNSLPRCFFVIREYFDNYMAHCFRVEAVKSPVIVLTAQSERQARPKDIIYPKIGLQLNNATVCETSTPSMGFLCGKNKYPSSKPDDDTKTAENFAYNLLTQSGHSMGVPKEIALTEYILLLECSTAFTRPSAGDEESV